MGYRRHDNGAGWRLDASDRIELEGEGTPRTEGRPITMATIAQDYGIAIHWAADRFDLRPALIAAMIVKEAVREQPDWWRRDPTSYRKEPSGVESGGLMQTLVRTAQQMQDKLSIYHGVRGHDAELIDHEDITVQDLYVPERSITLGAAYLRHLADYDGSGWDAPAGEDPVLLCCAYNAGGVYTSSKNRFHLRTYGAGRIETFAAYWNDWMALPDEIRCHGERS